MALLICVSRNNEPIAFVFEAPWADTNPEAICHLSAGDYLGLILQPSVKEDGTPFRSQGEVYRVEGAAFDSAAQQRPNGGAAVAGLDPRFFRVCFACFEEMRDHSPQQSALCGHGEFDCPSRHTSDGAVNVNDDEDEDADDHVVDSEEEGEEVGEDGDE